MKAQGIDKRAVPSLVIREIVAQPTGRSLFDTVCLRPGMGRSSGNIRIAHIQKRSTSLFPQVSLGRASNNDIVLGSPVVSKCHLLFRETARGWEVVDMGSTNGTMVQGASLSPGEPRLLCSGDELTIAGVYRAIFVEPEGVISRSRAGLEACRLAA